MCDDKDRYSLSEASGTMLQQLFGGTAKAMGAVLSARADYWMRGNLEKFAEKIQKKMPEGRAEEEPLSTRVMLKAVDNAAITDSELLQDMFAGLVAGSRSSEGKDDSNIKYLKILETMPEYEAKLLSLIYQDPRLGSFDMSAASEMKQLSLLKNLSQPLEYQCSELVALLPPLEDQDKQKGHMINAMDWLKSIGLIDDYIKSQTDDSGNCLVTVVFSELGVSMYLACAGVKIFWADYLFSLNRKFREESENNG